MRRRIVIRDGVTADPRPWWRRLGFLLLLLATPVLWVVAALGAILDLFT